MPDDHANPAAAGPAAAAAAPLLAVRNLNAWYGESHVLHGVDFDVTAGEVVTLLGRNGAGKTTTLKSIMGVVPRREGSIAFEGLETSRLASNRIARLGIAWCPRNAGSSRASMSREPAAAAGAARRPSLEQIYELFRTCASASRAKAPSCPAASSRCSRSAGSCARGRLLLLDERPRAGAGHRPADRAHDQPAEDARVHDPAGRAEFCFAATVADRHYVMDHGRVVDMIPNAELDANMEKLHDYLGV
jgi:branched-chain amino acid transport system ATP-binding protein